MAHASRRASALFHHLRASYATASSSSSSSSSPYVTRATETLSILRSSTGAGARDVYLVGTAHVSAESAREVRELMRVVKPSSVMLELCDERLRSMREKLAAPSGRADARLTFATRAVKDFASAFRGGDARDGLLAAAMKTMYGFFKLSGLEPGGEFIAAIEEADRQGARVVCGDRNVRETLRRVRERLTFTDVVNIATGRQKPGGPPPPPGMDGDFDDIENIVESLKTREAIARMREFMRFQMPDVARVFVDERDQIMTDAIVNRCQGERVVAVVGMAHMDGIEHYWELAQKRDAVEKC
jgi:pheromone shutdown protein TraB